MFDENQKLKLGQDITFRIKTTSRERHMPPKTVLSSLLTTLDPPDGRGQEEPAATAGPGGQTAAEGQGLQAPGRGGSE